MTKETLKPCEISATEIIDLLGGSSSVAKFLNITVPSVSEWKERNKIPQDKLIRLAIPIERATGYRITRQNLIPYWRQIWPNLKKVA